MPAGIVTATPLLLRLWKKIAALIFSNSGLAGTGVKEAVYAVTGGSAKKG
jgi:hypothetical protein